MQVTKQELDSFFEKFLRFQQVLFSTGRILMDLMDFFAYIFTEDGSSISDSLFCLTRLLRRRIGAFSERPIRKKRVLDNLTLFSAFFRYFCFKTVN